MCELPRSEAEGALRLGFTPSGNQLLLDAAKAVSKSSYTVGLVITGDNDVSDCQHSGLVLEARVTYEEN